MRIHDSMLEVSTRLRGNPYTAQSNTTKNSGKDAAGMSFKDFFNANTQEHTPVISENTESQLAGLVWMNYNFSVLPKPGQKIKSNAYQPLSDL